MRRLVFVPALVLTMAILGGQAAAGPEWCDSGSPPPNDFRFRPTGLGSFTSSLSWLRSTTSGTLDLAAGVNTLEGGVAKGMRTALEHARPYAELAAPKAGPDKAQRTAGEDDD